MIKYQNTVTAQVMSLEVLPVADDTLVFVCEYVRAVLLPLLIQNHMTVLVMVIPT